MEYHSTVVKSRMRQRCIEIMIEHKINSVLDYGCGIGQDSIEAVEAGLNATVCDLSGKTLNFAKWRFKKRNLPIKIIEITSHKPLIKKKISKEGY